MQGKKRGRERQWSSDSRLTHRSHRIPSRIAQYTCNHQPSRTVTFGENTPTEVPATVSSFYVSVLYIAMLRTSIAAVVLGCFYFCPFRLRYSGYGFWLRCCWHGMHAGKIQNGCIPAVLQQKGIYTYLVRIQNFLFSFSVWWDLPTSAFFHSRAFCFRVNRLHN